MSAAANNIRALVLMKKPPTGTASGAYLSYLIEADNLAADVQNNNITVDESSLEAIANAIDQPAVLNQALNAAAPQRPYELQ